MDNSINFTAIPRAKYNVRQGDKIVKAVTYQLEHTDIPVIDEMLKEHGKVTADDIYGQACLVAKELLEHAKETGNKYMEKTRIMVAKVGDRIAGISIYNEPRMNEARKVVNSSRKGATATEMEFDWMAKNPHLRVGNIGTMLSEDMLSMAKNEGCEQIYLRSAIDKKTKGFIPFHEEMLGAKKIGEKMEWEESLGNPDIYPPKCLDEFVYYGDDNRVIPMMVDKEEYLKRQAEYAAQLGKKELPGGHVNLIDKIAKV